MITKEQILEALQKFIGDEPSSTKEWEMAKTVREVVKLDLNWRSARQRLTFSYKNSLLFDVFYTKKRKPKSYDWEITGFEIFLFNDSIDVAIQEAEKIYEAKQKKAKETREEALKLLKHLKEYYPDKTSGEIFDILTAAYECRLRLGDE